MISDGSCFLREDQPAYLLLLGEDIRKKIESEQDVFIIYDVFLMGISTRIRFVHNLFTNLLRSLFGRANILDGKCARSVFFKCDLVFVFLNGEDELHRFDVVIEFFEAFRCPRVKNIAEKIEKTVGAAFNIRSVYVAEFELKVFAVCGDHFGIVSDAFLCDRLIMIKVYPLLFACVQTLHGEKYAAEDKGGKKEDDDGDQYADQNSFFHR